MNETKGMILYMRKKDYKLWVAYHHGKINRELTEKEYSEIRAFEFAMHLLIPTDKLLEVCGGFDNLKYYRNYLMINRLANYFCVPKDVMLFKFDYLIEKGKVEKNKVDVKKRIKKREKNIVFVNFD